MSNLYIYGASDDLIETEGLLREEFNIYGASVIVTVSVDDATYASVRVEYDPDDTGEWRIQSTSMSWPVDVVPAPGEDETPNNYDEHGCPPYSDKAVIDMHGIEANRVSLRCEVTT